MTRRFRDPKFPQTGQSLLRIPKLSQIHETNGVQLNDPNRVFGDHKFFSVRVFIQKILALLSISSYK